MTSGHQVASKAVDIAAAAILAGAVAFSASTLGGFILAAILAPLAFVLAYASLGLIDCEPTPVLAGFDAQPVAPPQLPVVVADDGKVVRLFDPRQLEIARPSAASSGGVREDAGQALSDALAQLKRSLR